jgi:hypothetical protein
MIIPVARDISLIILIVPACLCALVPAAMVFGAWWVTRRVRFALPPRIRQARSAVRRSRDALDRATGMMTRPVVYGHTQSARARAIWRSLKSRRAEQEN